MMVKAIIFDCDGVLIDSEYSHFLSWEHAISKYGKSLPLSEYAHYVGRSAPVNAQHLVDRIGTGSVDEILKNKAEHYFELQGKGIAPIEGAPDFVRALAKEKKERGILLGVASAAKREELKINLKQHGVEECFDVILSGYDDLTEYHDPEGVNKPKPYIYLEAAKRLGVQPQECVVIEDSKSGVEAGMRAGCKVVAVPNEFTKEQDLSQATWRLEALKGLSVDQFFHMISSGG